jgi:uncharacterized protein (TIGR02271 family)
MQTKTYDAWIGRDAFDRTGEKVGKIQSIYYDDQTERPEWVAVRTGLFGHKVTFVPIAGSSEHGDDLQVAYDKDTIKDAPNCDADGHLSEEEERRLYSHYQFEWDAPTNGYGDRTRADTGYENGRRGPDGDAAKGRRDDEAMTRSEEELRVGTEGTQRQATGRARLRKYVVTEHEQVTVPVTREEVRVEREPITDDNVGDALSGPDISEGEHEVVTHEERPVVSTETVPKQRVRLEKDTVTEHETVSGEVRKEKIDVEGDRDIKDDHRGR